MRALVLILVILIGALISLSVGAKRPHLPQGAAPQVPTVDQWVTSTDPHEDPQVSPAPEIQAPPHP